MDLRLGGLNYPGFLWRRREACCALVKDDDAQQSALRDRDRSSQAVQIADYLSDRGGGLADQAPRAAIAVSRTAGRDQAVEPVDAEHPLGNPFPAGPESEADHASPAAVAVPVPFAVAAEAACSKKIPSSPQPRLALMSARVA